MDHLLVIEDGSEYEEFARAFLSRWSVHAAHSARESIEVLERQARAGQPCSALLVDLRFERSAVDDLVGDIPETARRRFGGDRHRAVRHLKEQQGTLVLAELRQAGFEMNAVFVHDFSERRLCNLRRLYGAVHAVPAFDASAIDAALRAHQNQASF